LYYEGSGLLEFEATIVDTGVKEKNHYTILNRSAFYPTSGGQLHDTGTLNDIEITEVLESDTGQVLHISRQSVGEAGRRVKGVVDGMRRRRACQSHTAQHILSSAFIKLYDIETTGS
jgi:alanyl-tRNA synthetase